MVEERMADEPAELTKPLEQEEDSSSAPVHQGFSLYDSQTLQEVLDFSNHESILLKYNIKVNRQNIALNHLALLFKTPMYAMVFENKPNQVEFYDIDI